MILNIKTFIILPFILSLGGTCSAGEIVDDTLQSINLGDISGVSVENISNATSNKGFKLFMQANDIKH